MKSTKLDFKQFLWYNRKVKGEKPAAKRRFMNLFNKQKKTEDQKSATYLMKYKFNKGIEEKELGAFHERFCQFDIALGHYENAYKFFCGAEEMVEPAAEEGFRNKIVAYRELTKGKVLDVQEKIRCCGDGGRQF